MWNIKIRSVIAVSVFNAFLLISQAILAQQTIIDFEEMEDKEPIYNRYVDQGLDIDTTYDHGYPEEVISGPWVEYLPERSKTLCAADVFFHMLCGWPITLKFVEPGNPSETVLSDNVSLDLYLIDKPGGVTITWLNKNGNSIGTQISQNSIWDDSCAATCSDSYCLEADEVFTAPFAVGGVHISRRSTPTFDANCNDKINGGNAYFIDNIKFEPYDPTKQERDDKDCAPEGAGFGNPCDASSGNKYQREVDVQGTALPIVRYYSSQSALDIGLGVGWTSVYHKRLIIDGSAIRVYKGTGSSEGFLKRLGVWEGGVDGDLSLNEDVQGYTVNRPNGDTERYNLFGQIISENKNGQVQTYNYDAQDRLSTVIGAFGHTLTFQYSVDGNIQGISNPDQSFQYQYDVVGNLTEVIYPDSSTRIYHYEDVDYPHALTGITDERGVRIATYAYDVNGNASNTQHAETDNGAPQERFTLSYDSESQTTVVDSIGTTSILTFDRNRGSNNLVSSVNQADGKSFIQIFDRRNNLLSRTDNEGRITKYTYNSANQRLSETEAFGTPEALTTTYSYLSSSVDLPDLIKKPSVYPGGFDEKSISYDVNLNVDFVSESGYEPNGTVITQSTDFDYNALGQLTRIDGPRSDVNDIWQLDYHSCTNGGKCGQLASVSNAHGHTLYYNDYDMSGRLTQFVDASGLTTEYAYNARGRVSVIAQTPPVGPIRTTTYDYTANGNLQRVTSPAGLILSYTYDAANELRRITDNQGDYIEYAYDLSGNQSNESAHDSSGTLTYALQTAYDIRNRMASITSLGNTMQYVYDATGNLDDVIDAKYQTTDYRIDSLSRIYETLDALSGLTQYQYDTNNHLTRAEAPNGATTTYEYDDFGRLLMEGSPDRGTLTYRYDAAGNLIEQTQADGERVDYSYDAMNRLLQVSYTADATEDISYAYDDNSAGQHGIGRLAQITEKSGTLRYAYDVFGNVTADERTIDGTVYLIQYTYDQDNKLSEIIYPSGRIVNYLRDSTGRVAEITTKQDSLAVAVTLVSNIDYLPFGPMSSLQYANGQYTVINYDQAYRVGNIITSSVDVTVQNSSYAYDPVNNITQLVNNQSSPESQTFTYDALNRLDSAIGAYGSKGYDYDANGNRTLMTEDAQNTVYAYTAASNRLTDLYDASADWQYTYDDNGNTIAKTLVDGSGQVYGYSVRNRLAMVSRRIMVPPLKGKKSSKAQDTLIGSYTYNALGQRIGKSTASQSMTYLYGLDGKLFTEIGGDRNSMEYVYLEGQPIAVYKTVIVPGEPPAAEEVIIDNGQVGTTAVGVWDSLTSRKGYGADYQRASGGTGSRYAWTPSLSGGEYEVYAWWAYSKKYSTQVNYVINHDGIQSNVVVDHTRNGSQWNLLGSYTFSGNGSENLQVSDDNGQTVADAVKFVKILTPPPGQTIKSAYFIHSDHLGTPQSMTDLAGQTVWKVSQSPFGVSTPNEDVDGDGSLVEMNLRFPGQYFDNETGLHYNWNRYYDAGTGRYITSDLIGLDGGVNTYGYVENNSVNAIDPAGLVKLYGSWCGPNWTGGFRKSYDEMDTIERSVASSATDGLDQCCQTHDITYADCRANYPCDAKARQQCFQEADRRLSSCSAGTSGSPRQLILMVLNPSNGGNPNKSIEDYMRDSTPDSEDNASDCGCQSK